MKERITVLMGAGAMIEATGSAISTKKLTQAVLTRDQSDDDQSTALLWLIYKDLCEYHKHTILQHINHDETRFQTVIQDMNTCVNFEDILHTLEMLYAYKLSSHSNCIKRYKSVFPLFSFLKDEYLNISELDILKAIDILIRRVSNEIAKFENNYWKIDEVQWFHDFFIKLNENYELDIITMNYDSWLENILNDATDGYERSNTGSFKPELLYNCTTSTIAHLHGNIFIKNDEGGNNKNTRKISLEEYQNDANTPKCYHPQDNQSGEVTIKSPIISGLRKADKVLKPPFNVYLNQFMQVIQRNNRLLVIGYGYNDIYINELISLFAAIHDDYKFIDIDWLSDAAKRDISAQQFIPTNTFWQSMNCLDLPWGSYDRNFNYNDGAICFSNEKAKFYHCGFKDSIVHHAHDIINFLK